MAPDDDVPWLDDDEQRTWRSLLLLHQLLDDVLDRQLRTDAGLPHAYYQVLVVLSAAPGPLRMGDLAAALRWSPSRLSHAVGRMEADGWLARTPCPHDGRGHDVALTAEGTRVLRRAAPGHVRAVRTHLLDPLGPDRVALLGALCDTVLDHLLDPGDPGPQHLRRG